LTSSRAPSAGMKGLCLSEASRLDVVQTDLMENKIPAARSTEADYCIRVYEAIGNFIDICKVDPIIMERLKKITSEGLIVRRGA